MWQRDQIKPRKYRPPLKMQGCGLRISSEIANQPTPYFGILMKVYHFYPTGWCGVVWPDGSITMHEYCVKWVPETAPKAGNLRSAARLAKKLGRKTK